jgi:transposase
MRDTQLSAQIPGITAPWRVTDVALDRGQNEVRVQLEHAGETLTCPQCGKPCPGYDTRQRRWRHLDTCQYRTILIAEVPRVQCPTDGVKQIAVPWAEPNGRFTALFEALVIDWLKEASISAVARQLHLSWDEAETMLQRAVDRGLARRELEAPRHVAVDVLSQRRGHNYLTMVSDRTSGRVLHVAPDRKRSSLSAFYEQLGEAGCAEIASVTMDMWPLYIQATEAHVPKASDKIAFDKFPVAQHLGEAVDKCVLRAQDFAARGRCLAEREALPLASPSADDERSGVERSVRSFAGKHVEDSPGVGDQGGGDAVVGLPLASVGSQSVGPVLSVGAPQPA